ncbi:hepatic lectin-like protein [Leptotrombidium deliense]|uniref:Hepatic lectin-like protein n=1 Tax=Leptotrombidium deliense TaxID=299467 RepID=A0A443RZP0_9ACAR|nr:hepatic lectin-like protein [Leptotrombidium deliense]
MKEYCESIDAYLITIHTIAEQRYLVKEFPIEISYLGVHKNGSEWEWIDGKPHSFANWGEGQPNNHGGSQNCIRIFKTGHWDDCSCNTPLYTVCKPRNCKQFMVKQEQRQNSLIKNYIYTAVNESMELNMAKIRTALELQFYERAVLDYQRLNSTLFTMLKKIKVSLKKENSNYE